MRQTCIVLRPCDGDKINKNRHSLCFSFNFPLCKFFFSVHMNNAAAIDAIISVLKSNGDDFQGKSRVLIDFLEYETPNVSVETIVNAHSKMSDKSPVHINAPEKIEDFVGLRNTEFSSLSTLNKERRVELTKTSTTGVRSLNDFRNAFDKVNPTQNYTTQGLRGRQ